jgi:valyl-tRNA synthetase
VNRWAIAKTVRAAEAVDEALAAYRFNDAAGALYQFTWHQFCDWYIEFAKPVLTGEDESARAETRATIAWVMQRLLHLLHPFMPFITEELWEHFGGGPGHRLITAWWPQPEHALIDAEAEAEMDWVARAIGAVRTVRGEMNVPNKAEAPLRVSGANATTRRRLEDHATLIKTLAKLESLELTDAAAPANAAQFLIDEATAVMPLEGLIDVAQERQRLEKEIARLDKDVQRHEGKLNSAGFTAKAPADVVETERERRDEAVQARDKLKQALNRLQG